MSPKRLLRRLFRRTKNQDTTMGRHRRTIEAPTARLVLPVHPADTPPATSRNTPQPVPAPVIPEPQPVWRPLTPEQAQDVNVMQWFPDDESVIAWAKSMLRQRKPPEVISRGFGAYVQRHPATA